MRLLLIKLGLLSPKPSDIRSLYRNGKYKTVDALFQSGSFLARRTVIDEVIQGQPHEWAIKFCLDSIDDPVEDLSQEAMDYLEMNTSIDLLHFRIAEKRKHWENIPNSKRSLYRSTRKNYMTKSV